MHRAIKKRRPLRIHLVYPILSEQRYYETTTAITATPPRKPGREGDLLISAHEAHLQEGAVSEEEPQRARKTEGAGGEEDPSSSSHLPLPLSSHLLLPPLLSLRQKIIMKT